MSTISQCVHALGGNISLPIKGAISLHFLFSFSKPYLCNKYQKSVFLQRGHLMEASLKTNDRSTETFDYSQLISPRKFLFSLWGQLLNFQSKQICDKFYNNLIICQHQPLRLILLFFYNFYSFDIFINNKNILAQVSFCSCNNCL